MQVQKIQIQNFSNCQQPRQLSNNIQDNQKFSQNSSFISAPIGFKYGAQIHFGEFFDPNRTVPHIDYEEYMAMSENTKKRFRKRFNKFNNDELIDKKELIDQRYPYLPLRSEKSMDEFIKIAKVYTKYKDHPIICLGRSPKWFLNAALWMKDGIDDYKFVAFSRNWYREDITNHNEIVRVDSIAPTPKEELAYRRYLKRIKADPQTIVDHMKETGKKTVITDFVDTGKGMTSFLDIMSRYADDLGILKDFANSIQIVSIGSRLHVESRLKIDYASDPKVTMPEKLIPYEKASLWKYNITQEFYDMDYNMFEEMLVNQNTNECRSTYYPHEYWPIYKPDQIKTGLIKDKKTAINLVKELKDTNERTLSSFTPAMYDYRNLTVYTLEDF
jgi:hypothetical protein